MVDATSPAPDPPPVITFGALNTVSDVWDLEGTVTDNGKPVAGLNVTFGGVLSEYHLTATVQKNGTYSVSEMLLDITRGTGTAQTHGADGKASNVAMTYIVNEHVGTSSSDAMATSAPGNQASGSFGTLATDPLSTLAEVGGSTTTIATIATAAGTSRYSGDGGPAVDATLNCPQGVAVDSLGDLFIADTYNNVVREVNASTGVITTVAGNGICGYSGDGGAATSAELDAPTGVAIDAAGDIFIADS